MRNVPWTNGRGSSIRHGGGRRGVWGRGVESQSRNVVETPRVPSGNGRDRHSGKRIRYESTLTGYAEVSLSIDSRNNPRRPRGSGSHTPCGQEGEDATYQRSPPSRGFALCRASWADGPQAVSHTRQPSDALKAFFLPDHQRAQHADLYGNGRMAQEFKSKCPCLLFSASATLACGEVQEHDRSYRATRSNDAAAHACNNGGD